MKKSVIFDLDGTILNTLPDINAAINHALNDFGLDGITLEETRVFVGSGLRNSLSKAIEARSKGFILTEEDRENMFLDLIRYYNDHPDVNTRPYDGIRELMEKLDEKDIRLAVLSNKDESLVPYLVRRFFPGIRFSLVEGHKEGCALKPDPALMDRVLSDMGTTREETIIVGDSGVDYLTGKNSGLETIIVTYGFRHRDELSDCDCLMLDTVPELERAIFDRI